MFFVRLLLLTCKQISCRQDLWRLMSSKNNIGFKCFDHLKGCHIPRQDGRWVAIKFKQFFLIRYSVSSLSSITKIRGIFILNFVKRVFKHDF